MQRQRFAQFQNTERITTGTLPSFCMQFTNKQCGFFPVNHQEIVFSIAQSTEWCHLMFCLTPGMLQNPMYVTHSWTVLTSDCLGMFQCGAIVQTAILVKVYFLNEFLQEKNPAYEGKMIILYIFNRNHFPPPPPWTDTGNLSVPTKS